jgi:hypothetical protein
VGLCDDVLLVCEGGQRGAATETSDVCRGCCRGVVAVVIVAMVSVQSSVGVVFICLDDSELGSISVVSSTFNRFTLPFLHPPS